MKKLVTICFVCVCMTSIVAAKTDLWDNAKMHYPQLPDPYGWDVSFTSTVLADDWQCSETGPVSDIHFWISIRGWNDPQPPFEVGPAFRVSIRSDIPAEQSGRGYSMPGETFWNRDFVDGQYEGIYAGSGAQGWFDPVSGDAIPEDHTSYYLINITQIENPFWQEEGTIYWLELHLLSNMDPYEIGWKTSISEHFMDDAVYLLPEQGYQELRYPYNDPQGRDGYSIDLAFVITPEPATICMLGLGTLSLIRRKNNNK